MKDKAKNSAGSGDCLPKVAKELLIPAVLGVLNLVILLKGGLTTGNYIFVAAAAAAAGFLLLSAADTIGRLGRHDVDGATYNRIRALASLVALLVLFPLFRLVMPLVWLLFNILLSDGFSSAECEAIEAFLLRPSVGWAATGVLYLLCLWQFVARRLLFNPTRQNPGKRGKTAKGPDGKTYSLPDSYQTALAYLLGEKSDIYESAFENEIHRLMWATEAVEQAHRLTEGYCPRWEVSRVGSGAFARDSLIGKGVRWSQFGKLSRMAIDGWRHQGDEERALRYTRWVVEAGFLMGENGSFPVFGYSTTEVADCCGDLIRAYRKGRGNVRPDLSKALEYQNKLERFMDQWEEISLKANKMYEECEKSLQSHSSGESDNSSTSSRSSSGSRGSDEDTGNSDLDRLPARMSDGSRNTYVRTTGAGAYPVCYTCYETGDTVYIYRATLYGGFADTDCGSFYY